MNLSTEELVSTIKSLEETANFELDAAPYHVRGGFAIAAQDARTQLAKLKPEYRTRLLANSVAFVVTGPKVDAYAAEAVKTAPSLFVLEAGEMYEVIARQIEPTIGASREFTIHQFTGFMSLLRSVAREIGASQSIQQPLLEFSAIVPTREDLVAHVTYLVRQSVGHGFASLWLGNQIIEKALATGFNGTVLGAVIINRSDDSLDQELAQTFATRVEVSTEEDTEITNEFVIKTFELAKKIKSKRSK